MCDKVQPCAGFRTGLPSPQFRVRVLPGMAFEASAKAKFHEPPGSQILKVVRPLNVLICSGPVDTKVADGDGNTVTNTLLVAEHPSSATMVSV